MKCVYLIRLLWFILTLGMIVLFVLSIITANTRSHIKNLPVFYCDFSQSAIYFSSVPQKHAWAQNVLLSGRSNTTYTAKFPPPPNWILATEKECNDWNQSIWEMKNDKTQITCWVDFQTLTVYTTYAVSPASRNGWIVALGISTGFLGSYVVVCLLRVINSDSSQYTIQVVI